MDDTANQASYAAAFPSAVASMGCPAAGCTGYEIGAAPSTPALDIDLDTNGNGTADAGDDYWNDGAGWGPIPSYSATFEGNGNTVSGLFINKASNDAGLFHTIAATGKVRNLGLLDVDVTAFAEVGAMAASNLGLIEASYSTGSVTSSHAAGNAGAAGGLVGRLGSGGKLLASFSRASVTASSGATHTAGLVGGLVGSNSGDVIASYATGSVTTQTSATQTQVGGLVGLNGGKVVASYATGLVSASAHATQVGGLVGQAGAGGTVTGSYYDSFTSGRSDTGKGVGKTSIELGAPTGYSGIYAGWDVDLDNADTDDDLTTGGDTPWEFGTASQYPAIDYLQLTPDTQARQITIDYDTDDDGLIEINNAAQLNAVRWDPDGDGTVNNAVNQASYAAVFPSPAASMGCPASGCTGYEIGAAPSTPALNINLGVAPHNTGAGWVPLPSYSATFEGNGNTVSGLFINKAGSDAGLFHTIAATGKVRNLGLLDVDVTAHAEVGALAGNNSGRITASYSTGRVRGSSGAGQEVRNAGGLVGLNIGAGAKIHASYSSASVTLATTGAIHSGGGLVGRVRAGSVVASYATGPVSVDGSATALGGLVGRIASRGSVTASYATGRVSGTNLPSNSTGGLVGTLDAGSTVTASYYDASNSGRSDTGKGIGRTSAELGAPTGYTGIYAGWDVDLDGDGTNDDPWDFGTASQYPAIDYLQLTPDIQARQIPIDYDTDNDGLIEINSAAQLNAVRWDADGDGTVTTANQASYAAAFPSPLTGMGCPDTADDTDTDPGPCLGYELAVDINLDTNGNGMADAGDDYWNSGVGWVPLSEYSATFEGNGHTISGLFINRAGSDAGLFKTIAATGKVRNLGLLDVNVTAQNRVGALAGQSFGLIEASYSTGSVTVSHSTLSAAVVGGLVGRLPSGGKLLASFSRASVTASAPAHRTTGRAGGLVGSSFGDIIASYATGSVTTQTSATQTQVGGLVGLNRGTVVASYSTGRVSTVGGTTITHIGGLVGQDGLGQHRDRQLLRLLHLRPERHRQGRGQDQQRAGSAHRLHRHLRQLERGPERGREERQPVGLRHGVAVPGHRLPATHARHPGPADHHRLRHRQRRADRDQ